MLFAISYSKFCSDLWLGKHVKILWCYACCMMISVIWMEINARSYDKLICHCFDIWWSSLFFNYFFNVWALLSGAFMYKYCWQAFRGRSELFFCYIFILTWLKIPVLLSNDYVKHTQTQTRTFIHTHKKTQTLMRGER